ncbi:hypothetical protein BBB56_20185 [Candidatus Pantoea deserta]|uniref:Uncharacterized protein n=1 Tax=Candidatus Pantoea deserta TaxID=1869313 RepID=A0A3N4NIX2_9GAMM|nr:hypothetical protein BBB56_20185 [Pantoea deserta]
MAGVNAFIATFQSMANLPAVTGFQIIASAVNPLALLGKRGHSSLIFTFAVKVLLSAAGFSPCACVLCCYKPTAILLLSKEEI